MAAYVVEDRISDMATILRGIPYDFTMARCDGAEGGYRVELVAKDGAIFGSGTHPTSFSLAYRAAERDIEAKLQADYAATIADFEAGTGRR